MGHAKAWEGIQRRTSGHHLLAQRSASPPSAVRSRRRASRPAGCRPARRPRPVRSFARARTHPAKRSRAVAASLHDRREALPLASRPLEPGQRTSDAITSSRCDRAPRSRPSSAPAGSPGGSVPSRCRSWRLAADTLTPRDAGATSSWMLADPAASVVGRRGCPSAASDGVRGRSTATPRSVLGERPLRFASRGRPPSRSGARRGWTSPPRRGSSR